MCNLLAAGDSQRIKQVESKAGRRLDGKKVFNIY